MQPRADLDLSGTTTLAIALAWFMDNGAKFADGTTYRDYALHKLNNIEKVWVNLGACDRGVNFCGTATMWPITHADYMGSVIANWALAYTLLRNEMTPAQRTTFAEKALNGITQNVMPECENRLERIPGTIRIQKSTAGTEIQGQDISLSRDLAGEWLYVKRTGEPYAAGAFIQPSAINSPTSGATREVPYYLYLDRPLDVYRVKPWKSGQCGMGFVASHHGNLPKYAAGYAQMRLASPLSASSTVMVPTATQWIPKHVPFYVKMRGTTGREIVKVTAVNGNQLTITRGEFSTPALDLPVNALGEYSTHDTPGDATGWNNRTLTRHVGHLMIALALADDDPRAITLLKDAEDFWVTNVWFTANNYFTMANTSTNSYGLTRLLPFMLWEVQSMYSSFEPALDFRGEWVKRGGSLFFLYWTSPWDQLSMINWGIPSSNCQTLKSSAEVQCVAPAAYVMGLYPGSPEAAYAWRWLNEQGFTSNVSRLALISSQRLVIPLLMYGGSGAAQADYRQQLLPHYIANSTDDDSKDASTNFSVAVSRTDWTSSASQLYVLAADHNTKEFPTIPLSDKFHDHYNADYGIGKLGGWFLGQTKPDGVWMRYAGNQNVVDFGPLSQLAFRPWADLEIDRKRDNSAKYLYMRTNLTKGYSARHQVTHAYRYFAHFKAPGTAEHVVVYDDYATKLQQRIRGMLHYPNNGQKGEGDTTLNEQATAINTHHAQGRMHTSLVKVSGSGIVTDLNVLWKLKQATIGSYCSTENPCRARIGSSVYTYTSPAQITVEPSTTGVAEVYVWLDPGTGKLFASPNNATVQCGTGVECLEASSDFPSGVIRLARLNWTNNRILAGCPGQTATSRGLEYDHCVGETERHVFMDNGQGANAEFLVVHKPGGLDVQPDPLAQLQELSPGFTGVQIEGPNPKVAVFSQGGIAHPELVLRTTHSGSAQYLITGLVAGKYTVSLNKQVISSDIEVAAGEEALYFESESGVLTIHLTGQLPALSISQDPLPTVQVGDEFAFSFQATGGLSPYLWSTSGTLPPGLTLSSATGTLSGLPEIEGAYAFTLVLTASNGDTISREINIDVKPLDVTLRFPTQELGLAVVGQPFQVALQIKGGAAPYQWFLAEGTLPAGLELDDETGTVSGMPTESGEFTVTIGVRDSSGSTTNRTFLLEVAES